MGTPHFENQPAPEEELRFRCGSCGYELKAGVEWAGKEAPCPVCGTAVRAPLKAKKETAWLELPVEFWTAPVPEPLGQGEAVAQAQAPVPVPVQRTQEDKIGPIGPIGPISSPSAPVGPLVENLPAFSPGAISRILQEVRSEEKRPVLPAGKRPVPGTRTQPVYFPEGVDAEDDLREEGAAAETRRFRLRFFDAALVCLFLGTLAVGTAAVAFTQSKQSTVPPAPPELSKLVVERMQALDLRKDRSVQSARQVLERLMVTPDAAAAESLLIPPGVAGAAGLEFPMFAGSAPADFEFIQARRIPGTDRFLTLFELAADPPLVIPVEETADGSRMHGMAVAQQAGGKLGKFLASQGQGEAVFYVLLRPAPAAMEAEMLKARPDLQAYRLVGVEPAFPGDGATGCLVGIAPGSVAEAVFGKRAHDPGLRPAVVRLAWRQHRESGNYVELTGFLENAWSRH